MILTTILADGGTVPLTDIRTGVSGPIRKYGGIRVP